jgi:hypothetical protein
VTGRPSRRDLWEPGGEIPPGHPTLSDHRKELGTRKGTRALTCYKQAKFLVAWFRDKADIARLGRGFGISQSTAYRYKDEGVAVLAAKAPSLEGKHSGPLRWSR